MTDREKATAAMAVLPDDLNHFDMYLYDCLTEDEIGAVHAALNLLRGVAEGTHVIRPVEPSIEDAFDALHKEDEQKRAHFAISTMRNMLAHARCAVCNEQFTDSEATIEAVNGETELVHVTCAEEPTETMVKAAGEQDDK